MLEHALEDNINKLKYIHAICWDENDTHTWEFQLHPIQKFFTFVDWPTIN
jgi:hypothetical protein